MQLAGELSKVNLPSLIQLVRNGELTGKICLTCGVNTAFIYVEQGRVLHVETDVSDGREALLELFLWTSGTFSYIECPVSEAPITIAVDEPIEKILRDGLAYLEAKKFLDQMKIGPATVLKSLVSVDNNPMLANFDGEKPLEDWQEELGLTRFECTIALAKMLKNGQVVVMEDNRQEGLVQLPDWVIQRLKQDNPDVSQAIVELVVWADRIKCWLYQADADLERIISTIEGKDGEAKLAPAINAANATPVEAVEDGKPTV